MKKALVLPGGLPQIALLEELKKRGIFTILGDGSEQPLARPYADTFYQIPIFDIEAVKEVAVREEVDYILTVCADQVLKVVAEVAADLGLPWYLDPETAEMVSDKRIMKKVFRAHDIPTSEYILINRDDTLEDMDISHLKPPLVLKPVDSYSSKGVRKVQDRPSLEAAFSEAIEVGRAEQVILEEFCEGEEISIDAFIVDGKAHILCISNSKKMRDEGRFVIVQGRYPAQISHKVRQLIQETVQNITEAFHLENGPLLVQMISDGTSVSVLEFSARTGGAMKWLLIRQVSGFDVVRAVVDLTLGKPVDVSVKLPSAPYIVTNFIYCYPGTFDRLEGVETLLEEGVVETVCPLKTPGRRMRQARSSSDRVAGVLIEAQNPAEMNEKMDRINETLKVLDADGNDIMRHDLCLKLSTSEDS